MKIKQKAVKYSILMTALVFICGFGVMCLLYCIWKKNNPESSLPGLFYYKAATIGDSICLPILVGSLYYHHIYSHNNIFLFGKASIVACIITVIFGICIQAEWLINDNTGLNWSLPYTHHFNVAGWYHAIFFVSVLSIIVLLLIEYMWYPSTLPYVIIDFLIYFSLIFFCLLHYIDDYIDIKFPALSLLFTDVILIGICLLLKKIQHIKLKSSSKANYIAILFSGNLAYLLSLTQI